MKAVVTFLEASKDGTNGAVRGVVQLTQEVGNFLLSVDISLCKFAVSASL